MSSDGTTAEGPGPTDLRVEYEADPGNVDPTSAPRFSWRIETDRRGARQTAYRVVVGRDRTAVANGRGQLWDSGRVDSGRATAEYDGPDLPSDETYHWSVECWTGDDAGAASETAWAEPSTFATALAPEDWCGDWIAHQPGTGDSNGWRSRWRDVDWAGEEWVQVDLGESRAIDAVELHPAEPVDVVRTPDGTVVTTSWSADPIAEFGFPDAYRIEVADEPEFADPAVVADVVDERSDEAAETDGAPAEAVTPRTHEDLDARGRYVRVTATDPFVVEPATGRVGRDTGGGRRVERASPWQCFALAGLSVRGADDGGNADGDDFAGDRPVEASSTVETDTWGGEHLVNDHRESHRTSSSPLLRTEFGLDRSVKSARIHVASVGYGELYVNGERVGDRRLDPAWTEYERRVLYASHDVTEHLTEGANALGLWLGRGWFAKRSAYWIADGSPRARVALTVEFEDGTTRRLSTGDD